MPCDEWRRLAGEEKSHRLEYSYFAFNKEMAGVSETRRKRLMKEHKTKQAEASKAKYDHQRYCPICKNEPAENFLDPDPWNKGLKK